MLSPITLAHLSNLSVATLLLISGSFPTIRLSFNSELVNKFYILFVQFVLLPSISFFSFFVFLDAELLLVQYISLFS